MLILLQTPFTPSNENHEDLSIFVGLLGLFIVFILPILYFIQSKRKYRPSDLRRKYRPVLAKIPYYNRLSAKEQKRFRKRVQLFINTKSFIPRSKGFLLTDEMIAQIAAAAVELSFGFRRFSFDQFQKILVYPDDYYSTISKRYHRGEVNLRGFIILSWAAFKEGYDDPEDGINLGIHEMAHALKLENKIRNSDYNFISQRALKELENHYHRFVGIGGPLQGFFRDYAQTNIHEFFAVSCENFLERSLAFKKKDPEFYNLMTQILNQDPLLGGKLNIPKAKKADLNNSSGPVLRY